MGATSNGGAPEPKTGPELDRLRELVAEHPPLPDVEVDALLAEVGEQGLEARSRRLLAQHHLWLVLEEVSSVGDDQVAADLFQEGSTALLKIVHGLASPSRLTPAEFQAAARAAVRETVKGAVEEEREAREADQRWSREGEQLALAEVAVAAELGRPPSDLELAAHLGWSLDRTVQLRRAVDEARAQYDREMVDLLGELEGEE
ncbi:MAG: hypothetical protein WBU92_05810 [Candidatus Dormiibacterota bacterium]